MSLFKQHVLTIIRAIPHGQVASYGQVALYAGIPRAARQVGMILRYNEEDKLLPWWRVINNQGRITIKGNLYNSALLQKRLLEDEGIKVNDDYTLDIEKYRFKPDPILLEKLELPNEYINKLLILFS